MGLFTPGNGPSFPERHSLGAFPLPTPRTWYVRRIGSDSNGGTSATVRSTGTDGATTKGSNVLTSASASWTSADIGHGIFINSNWRIIIGVNSATTLVYDGTSLATGSSQTWTVGGPFLTLTKTFNATAPIRSGDTIYIGAGRYGELSGNLTNSLNFEAETSWIADWDGSHTGDVGEVIWTEWNNGSDRNLAGANSLLLLQPTAGVNAVKNVTIRGITFVKSSAGSNGVSLANNVTLFKMQYCSFHWAAGIQGTVNFGVNAGWTFDSCIFNNGANVQGIGLTLTSAASGVDYNAGIYITNCFFTGSSTGVCIQVNPTGGAAIRGGGVYVVNCTANKGTNFVNTTGTTLSIKFPCYVYNCIALTGTAVSLNSGLAGALVEDYNYLWTTGNQRTNVSVGLNSSQTASDLFPPTLEYGQSLLYGFAARQIGVPVKASPFLGYGGAQFPTTDVLGGIRPGGEITLGDLGTATAGANQTLTNSGKNWPVNGWSDWVVKIVSGTGSGQTKTIQSNTATVLTVDGLWNTNPDNTSVYQIYEGCPSTSGKATSGSSILLTDSNAAWISSAAGMWRGFTLSIDGGTGAGRTAIITSSDTINLNFADIGVTLDSTSTYSIYRGTGRENVVPSIGWCGRNGSAIRDTATVRNGTTSLRLQGAGFQDFVIPVTTLATTITVYTQFDSSYAGTKPQMIIVNGTEAGVAAATATAVGSSGGWIQLSLTFTPTSVGLITVRLQSNSTIASSAAYFDDFNVV